MLAKEAYKSSKRALIKVKEPYTTGKRDLYARYAANTVMPKGLLRCSHCVKRALHHRQKSPKPYSLNPEEAYKSGKRALHHRQKRPVC